MSLHDQSINGRYLILMISTFNRKKQLCDAAADLTAKLTGRLRFLFYNQYYSRTGAEVGMGKVQLPV